MDSRVHTVGLLHQTIFKESQDSIHYVSVHDVYFMTSISALSPNCRSLFSLTLFFSIFYAKPTTLPPLKSDVVMGCRSMVIWGKGVVCRWQVLWIRTWYVGAKPKMAVSGSQAQDGSIWVPSPRWQYLGDDHWTSATKGHFAHDTGWNRNAVS